MLREEFVVYADNGVVVHAVRDVVFLFRLKGKYHVTGLFGAALVPCYEKLALLQAVLRLFRKEHFLNVFGRYHKGGILRVEPRPGKRGAKAKVVVLKNLGQGFHRDLGGKLLLLFVEPFALVLFGNNILVLEQSRRFGLQLGDDRHLVLVFTSLVQGRAYWLDYRF